MPEDQVTVHAVLPTLKCCQMSWRICLQPSKCVRVVDVEVGLPGEIKGRSVKLEFEIRSKQLFSISVPHILHGIRYMEHITKSGTPVC